MKINAPENNQINFGYNYNTHRKIVKKLIQEEFPKLQKYSVEIEKAVIMPDFDELGFQSNTHFYFSLKNYFRPRASFLDIDGSHNAYSRYSFHIDNFFNALKNSRFNIMAQEIGRAKHFLDDVSIGLHTKQGNFLQKWNEVGIHSNFEKFIYNHEDEFIANSKPLSAKINADTFDDIFVSVVDYSSNSEMPNKNNLFQWPRIAQNTINLTMESSRAFFTKISDMLK